MLAKLAAYPRRLADLGDDYFSTEMFHETMPQRDGTIVRNARPQAPFRRHAGRLGTLRPTFLPSPIRYYKTPQAICNTPTAHYDR